MSLSSRKRHPDRIENLLASSGSSDVVDAALIEFAFDGDEILTTGPLGLVHLAESASKELFIVGIGA
jgi:hypothetical protein